MSHSKKDVALAEVVDYLRVLKIIPIFVKQVNGMSKLEFIVVAAAMFASCTAEPPQTLMQPGVKTLTGERLPVGSDTCHINPRGCP